MATVSGSQSELLLCGGCSEADAAPHRAKWLARSREQRLQCFGSWHDRLQGWDVFAGALTEGL